MCYIFPKSEEMLYKNIKTSNMAVIGKTKAPPYIYASHSLGSECLIIQDFLKIFNLFMIFQKLISLTMRNGNRNPQRIFNLTISEFLKIKKVHGRISESIIYIIFSFLWEDGLG